MSQTKRPVRFNRRQAEKELATLISETEICLDADKYPLLAKMEIRGIDHNWTDYLAGKFKCTN